MKGAYVAAVLLGAGLLFLVQPMSARMLLPLLGGAPAVWNTCLVFFQASLLLGYAYAHALTSALRPRTQAALHLLLLVLAGFLLPPALPAIPPPAGRAWPTAWLLLALARSVGLPFFVLATTGPLLQRWLAETRLPGARDPYALYAAGNAGSFAGLLAYPFVVERFLGLRAQTIGWSVGYVSYGALLLLCALPLLRGGVASREEPRQEGGEAAPSWPRRLRWLLLAFVPASLVLGTTQYLTTDVAAVPLLWVLPLALYLLTFVVAFAPAARTRLSLRAAGLVLACAAVPAAVGFAVYSRPYALAFPAFHLAALVAAGILCHGALAEDRPGTAHLTEFYLLLATGGVLGGIFNALLAPVLFDSLLEYPLMLVAACALRAAIGGRKGFSARADLAAPAAVLLARWGADTFLVSQYARDAAWVWLGQIALPALACLGFAARRVGFALAFCALVVLAWTQGADRTKILHAERTFFGVTRVEERLGPPLVHPDLGRPVAVRYHVLYHGTTIHGKQALAKELHGIPTSYYHPTGPVGRLFVAFSRDARLDRVALVGLGAGTLAAYGRPGQTMTVYEIDPEVLRTASDPRLFTFLAGSRASLEVLLVDGRLGLAAAPPAAYGLIVLDAFSSDAIPVHLLTREALALYASRLREDGILAVHVTNRYLDLVPVVSALAADAGLAALLIRDTVDTPRQRLEGKDSSTWVLLARDRASLGELPTSPHAAWLPPPSPPAARYLWTDSFSNVISVFKLAR